MCPIFTLRPLQDNLIYDWTQVNMKSGFERAVKREPLTPGEEIRVPLYGDVYKAEKAAAAIPTPSVTRAQWNLVLDDALTLTQSLSCDGSPAMPHIHISPAPIVDSSTASGVLLATLSGAATLDAAEKRVRELVAAGRRVSETPHSLKEVPGIFADNVIAADAYLRATGCSVVVADAASLTVCVEALGAMAVLKGEAALLMWINREIAMARNEEAAKGAVTYPEDWEPPSHGGSFDPTLPGCCYFDVGPGTEYDEVLRRFTLRPDGSLPAFQKPVLRVQRIQNPLSWAGYFMRRRKVAEMTRNAGSPNEL